MGRPRLVRNAIAASFKALKSPELGAAAREAGVIAPHSVESRAAAGLLELQAQKRIESGLLNDDGLKSVLASKYDTSMPKASEIQKAAAYNRERNAKLAKADDLKRTLTVRQQYKVESNYNSAANAWREKDQADAVSASAAKVSLKDSGGYGIENLDAVEQAGENVENATQKAASAWSTAKSSNYKGDSFKNRAAYRNNVLEDREYQRMVADGQISATPLQRQIGNQAAGSPASGTPIQDIMQNAQRDAAQNNASSSFNASMKALRKKGGTADLYAAKRIEGEHNSVVDMINAGNYGDAAKQLELTGNYTKANRHELLNAAHSHYAGQAQNGPGMMDYINGHKIISSATGLTIAGGTAAAIMSNTGGQKSNAELYSSPF